MAAGATIHTFDVDLSDVDRGVYEPFTIRAARHPSETDAYMMTRVLAYCLEYADGIAFGEGISSTSDEPAVRVADPTGAITTWIEIGAPDAARLHVGSRAAERTVVYTHRDPGKVAAQWQGKRIHRADELELVSFDDGFVEAATAPLARRNTLRLSRVDGHLYLELNGALLETDVQVRTGF
jgi:uncharacterized protein YaeQ